MRSWSTSRSKGARSAVPAGTSILEAAKTAGVLIPHYCYHPGLPVAGVCRMCLVEVEKAPKLAPSCATAVAEGQVVHVHSRQGARGAQGRARDAAHQPSARLPDLRPGRRVRAAGLHVPGRARRRPLREPQAVQPGRGLRRRRACTSPTAASSARAACASWTTSPTTPCSTCSERGDRALHRQVRGARTSRTRGPATSSTSARWARCSPRTSSTRRAPGSSTARASVCPGCSQGCNMIVETRDNMVVRLQAARRTTDVNQYFMCDEGRLNYRWMNRQDRVELPMVRQGATLAAADWEVALAGGRAVLKGKRAYVLASPDALQRSAVPALAARQEDRRRGGVPRASRAPKRRCRACQDLALRADRAANVTRRRAARLRAQPTRRCADLQRGRRAHRRRRRTAPDCDAPDVRQGRRDHRHRHDAACVGASRRPPSCCRSPTSPRKRARSPTFAGRVQRFLQAKAAPGFARPSWFVLADLLAALGETADYRQAPGRVRRAGGVAAGVRRHVLRRARAQGRAGDERRLQGRRR